MPENPSPHVVRQGAVSSTLKNVYPALTASQVIHVYGDDVVIVDGATGATVFTCVGEVGIGAKIWFFAPNLTTTAALVLPNGDVFRGGSNTTVTLDADDERVELLKITATTWVKWSDPNSAALS